MSVAQEQFDKKYREMRFAVTIGILSKEALRDWLWVAGNQTALAAELEMNVVVESRAKDMAERELMHELTRMFGDQRWGPERHKDEE